MVIYPPSLVQLLLIAMFAIAAYQDVRERAVARWAWLPAIVTVPVGVYLWFLENTVLSVFSAVLAVSAVAVGVAFLNRGDALGIAVLFLSLPYNAYPIFLLMWIGAWSMVAVAGIFMMRKGWQYRVPYVAILFLAGTSAILTTYHP